MEKQELIDILEKGFDRRWQSLANKRYSESKEFLMNYFLIDNILETVNSRGMYIDNSLQNMRYQRRVLSHLSSEFAFILYFVSNKGTEINERSIFESQRLLKTSGKCKVYPCTKLFD